MLRIAALLVLLAGGASAQEAAGTDLAARLEAAVSAFRLRGSRVGVCVAVIGGDVVYARNERDPLRIASNTKLFTTAAALERLGERFRFRTSVGLVGRDLHIFAGGDPGISGRFHDDDPTAVFRSWAAKLKEAGVTRVGALVLHTGIFDEVRVHPGWKEYEPWVWWSAPFGPLSLNDNCVDLRVEPGPDGRPARIRPAPETEYLTLVNQTRSSAKPQKPFAFTRQAGSAVVTLRGDIGVRGTYWVSVPDPTAYFGAVLRETLAREGVSVEGPTEESSQLLEEARGYRELAAWESGLPEALAVCNQSSQNFYAEMIHRTLAWKTKGKGTTEHAVAAVEEFLKEAGVEGAVLVDGSGLSKDNRATAQDLVRLLLHMRRRPGAQVFMDSLAVNGDREGTLRRRLRDADLKGRVRAKTGHVAGVSALSGYADAPDGRAYAFSILVNAEGSAAAGDGLQNRIVETLLRRPSQASSDEGRRSGMKNQE
jgi:D-alanyl-D-alanine carboxypeptidase/D-alanyl-D-alanine-endopeptidase (penicillin-binding protein 4)